MFALAPGGPARAVDGFWSPTPVDDCYGCGGQNFVGGVRPDILTGTAFFGASTITNLTVVVDSLGGFTFNAGAPAYTFSGAGQFNLLFLTFNGAGIVTNGANATFNLAAGNQIRFNNASTAGSATFNNNGGSISFSNTSTAGNAVITNLTPAAGAQPSVVFFSNTSTAGNATITNQAGDTVLQFLSQSTAGNATIVNHSNFPGGLGLTPGGVQFLSSSTAGNANITNDGTIIFTGTSTAGSATITNAGTGVINFNQRGTAGSANIANAGTINFLGINAGNTAKAGSATISNTGTINFNNFSTALSANITNNNALNFNASSTAGSANIINAGTTNFNDTSSAGSANLTNTGTINFNNASTAGAATITSSGLVNFNTTDTTSTATATFNAGGLLTGIGALGNTTFNAGATFTRNAGETFRFNGNLNLNAGSMLSLFVTPTTAPLVTVTGAATLAGGVTVSLNQRLIAAASYRIIDAAALSGMFSGATVIGNFATNPTFTYDLVNGDVFLNLGPGLLTPILPAGANSNVMNVANAIDTAILGGAPLPAGFGNVFNLTGANLTNALAQISGEPTASLPQAGFQAMGSFLSLMLDPFNDSRNNEGGGASSFADEALGYAAKKRDGKAADAFAAVTPRDRRDASFERRWSVWASGYGCASSVSGNATTG
ncbi:MAG: hypothetical protein HY244_19510, partial [Rhizobiales bacterium]|nr:hypothetical protein [Hyphomicrobiales bacterium]